MAKVIMVQGTMSNVGKSFLVAGLCRVFKQDGYKVAPFKSQNMALNSFITKEGLEMGRAQVMQAEAAGIEPSVDMNPILLKPMKDMESQVIVNGKVFGNLYAMDYYKRKREFLPDILSAYERLNERYDIIVVEGAGSPAEINLKQDDFVNMGLAKYLKAPVLLVGDIDRGGVFAQLIGTVLLLEDDERALIKGSIINKFRGDIKILNPGLEMLEEKSNIPVLGVLPFADLDLEDEDSLSTRFYKKKEIGLVDIVVIHLPHISNFTDFLPLENIDGVSLRYIKRIEELNHPDMIILPGTKNTLADLKWLRENGLEAMILKEARKGTFLFGICGGYQMLGENLRDSFGAEGGGEMLGIGLLPMNTQFLSEKVCTRVRGKIEEITGPYEMLSGIVVEGYEIHMGTTARKEGTRNFALIKDGERTSTDGAVCDNVCGTYIHGIFDQCEVVNALINMLFYKKGICYSKVKTCNLADYKEEQYDKLAQIVREGLNIEQIYQLLEEGV